MHLTTLMDWEADRIRKVLDLAHEQKRHGAPYKPVLERKSLALLFEKASMRTRVSFEVAMTQLGGSVTYLSREDVNLGQREPIKDGARVLSRYVDGIAARTYAHQTVEELAAYSRVPVINALSDKAHPCQALADMVTIEETFDEPGEVKIAFIGDGNNVSASLATACAKLGYHCVVASPTQYALEPEFIEALRRIADGSGGSVRLTDSPAEAADGADVLYTDVWTSMGQEDEAAQRRRAFEGYCVDTRLLSLASPRAIVMHDLPAHRGEEITDQVIEGSHSAVFDQAENRLHAERALLQILLG